MEQVLCFINDMYYGKDVQKRQHAQDQLFQLQKNVEFWQLAFDLLQNPAVGGFPRGFACDNRMRPFDSLVLILCKSKLKETGLMCFWLVLELISRTQINADSQIELKNRLLEELFNKKHDQAVTTKLALSIAAYIIQTTPQEWENPVKDIMDIGKTNIDYTPVALDILTVIPEEVSRESLPSSQSKLNASLCSCFSAILEFLDVCMGSEADSNIRQKSARCLQSWIQFDMPVHLVGPLIDKVLVLLRVDETFESASDVLQELFLHPQSLHYETSICQVLLPQLSLGWFREKFDVAYESQDEDTALTICRLLVTLGENFVSFILKNAKSPEVISLLDIIFKCSSYPGYFPVDEEVSEHCLHFWYVLQDTLMDFDLDVESSADSFGFAPSSTIALAGDTNSEEMLPISNDFQIYQNKAFFEELYCKLIPVLCSKAMFPPDTAFCSSLWSSECKARFKTYRRDIADTLMYCCYVVHEKCLDILYDILVSITDQNEWQPLESLFFCTRAVADSLGSSPLPKLNDIVLFIFSIRNKAPKLTQSILLFLGSYSSWLAGQSREQINSLLLYIMDNMASSDLLVSNAAHKSFAKICDSCRCSLSSSLQPLVEMFVSASETMASIGKTQFLQGISFIIQALPTEHQGPPVEILIGHITRTIKSGLELRNRDYPKSVSIITENIRYLNAIMRGIQFTDEDPESGAVLHVPYDTKRLFLGNYSNILRHLWNIITPICENYHEDDISQLLATFLEVSILAFKSSLAHGQGSIIEHNIFVLPDLSITYCESFCNLMVKKLDFEHHIAYIEGLSSLVTVFGPIAELSSSPIDQFLLKYTDLTGDHYTVCKQLSSLLYHSIQTVVSGLFAKIVDSSALYENGTIASSSISLQAHIFDRTPDITESLISLIENAMKKHPCSILSSEQDEVSRNNLKSLALLLLSGIMIKDRQSFRSYLQLLNHILLIANNSDSAEPHSKIAYNLIKWIGQTLIRLVIEGICFSLPRTSLNPISDILYRYIVKFPDESFIQIRHSLRLKTQIQEKINEKSEEMEKISLEIRENFSKQVLSTRHLKRFRDIISEFAMKTRGTFPLEFS